MPSAEVAFNVKCYRCLLNFVRARAIEKNADTYCLLPDGKNTCSIAPSILRRAEYFVVANAPKSGDTRQNILNSRDDPG